MHRRQYIPGSHVKVSRAELAGINRNLREKIRRKQEERDEQARATARAERQRATTGMRGLINRVKRVLNTPIKLLLRGR